MNDQPGSGLVWTSDVNNGNLRIYKAVPENGLMVQLQSFNIPSTPKFTRPVFGDGRAYVGSLKGLVYGFGSPVNSPLNCTATVPFGTLELGTSSQPQTVTCQAKTAVVISNVTLSGNANFVVSGLPAVPIQVPNGGTFTFQAAFKPVEVGPVSSDIIIATNGATGFSTTTPVTLRGTGQSGNALLQVNPRLLSFAGAITGTAPDGVEQSVFINNLGNKPLLISKIGFSTVGSEGPFTPGTVTPLGIRVGAFTFIGLPDEIPAQSSVTVRVNFDTSASGNFAAFGQIESSGGNDLLRVVGVSGDAPVSLIEFQSLDGTSWIKYSADKSFSFGNVTENTTRSLKMRITNRQGSDGASLQLTVSKPPFGGFGIIGAVNSVDLAEGTRLGPGESMNATLFCSVPKSQWNIDPYPGSAIWTLSTNDNTGKNVIQFDCQAVAEQSVPLQNNGDQARYRYIGCYLENNPGRQLSKQYYGAADNTIPKCTDACAKAGSVFCGAQYHRECWGGNTIPLQKAPEVNCNFDCSGALFQTCGGSGEGVGQGKSYISLFADIDKYDPNGTQPISSTATSGTSPTATPIPTGGPVVNPGVGSYGSIGCYTEATAGRALPNGFAMPAGSRNVATCIAGCASKNYLYAGLEYGQECWCGNVLGSGSVPALASDCKMVCVDNAGEFCGAGSRLNVYRAGAVVSSSSTQTVTQSSSSSSTIASSSSSSTLTSVSLTSTTPVSLT